MTHLKLAGIFLYNDSLGERNVGWGVGYWIQKQLLTLRRPDAKYCKTGAQPSVTGHVLLRLDKAYRAFFNKVAKFPRFQGQGKYNSFTCPQYGGFQFKDNRLAISFIGAVRRTGKFSQ